MKRKWVVFMALSVLLLMTTLAYGAYVSHNDQDSGLFLDAYPDKAGTKLDHCALCHRSGEITKKSGTITLGSCQWCHEAYGYDKSGNILDTMNGYGLDYGTNGKDTGAFAKIDQLDSDNDGYTNAEEIAANRFPGDANDTPALVEAPYKVYTRAQLEALPAHTQFMLMNSSRGGTTGLDSYDEYTGVVMEDLLNDVGMLSGTSGITVFAADGWAQSHPLDITEGDELYYIRGEYPQAVFHYNETADYDDGNNPVGWVDYGAPQCIGRSDGQQIIVDGGLRAILAYLHNGTPLQSGVLSSDNKLDGEGPFRLVVPQKSPGVPDQPSGSTDDTLPWAYDEALDHNAGASSRTVTFIRVEPLPPGTTDINVYEEGWRFVDEEKIVIYGNIAPTDSIDLEPAAVDGSVDDSDSNILGCFISVLSGL